MLFNNTLLSNMPHLSRKDFQKMLNISGSHGGVRTGYNVNQKTHGHVTASESVKYDKCAYSTPMDFKVSAGSFAQPI